jgi:MFS family permease
VENRWVSDAPKPSPIPVSTGTADRPASWRAVLRERGRLTVGLVLLESVTAVQVLIVITIMPVIAHDLGGLRLYGWAFSASTLAAMVSLPATAHWGDQWGPAPALVATLSIFVAGTILAAAAPTMLVLVAGRFLQGWGLGASWAVSLGAVAKTYPWTHRPRVLALMSAAWVVPGLVGPTIGAIFARTVGWRWAFLASLPVLVVATWMAVPELGRLPRVRSNAAPVPLRWVLQLGVSAAALLAALTGFHWWSVPTALVAIAVLIPALRRILPEGTLRARPGLPSAVAAMFLLSFAYIGVDGFVPLLLTGVRHQSVAMGGLVVTLAAVAWAGGTWWQSRAVSKRSRGTLVSVGTALVLAGSAGVWAGLLRDMPLAVVYVAWTVGGLGMGVAYPTLSLVAMEQAERGGETQAVAAITLTETFGAALGPGLGGSAIAIATGAGASLAVGLSGAFGLAVLMGAALLLLTGRLPNPARPNP